MARRDERAESRTLERLMAARQLGSVRFVRGGRVRRIDPIASGILKGMGQPHAERDIFDLFPELVGSEDAIEAVLDHREEALRIPYVNRGDQDGGAGYLHLFVFADADPGTGLVVIENVTDRGRMWQELNQHRYDRVLRRYGFDAAGGASPEALLGESPLLQELRKNIRKIGGVPSATVLLLGETGTGKSLAAHMIHVRSMAADAPFVEINCAALPEQLVEAELFGHEKGAFTDAKTARAGLLQAAEGGTLFLDEIGDMDLALQAKLLSVIETRRYRRIGSHQSLPFKARIIAATHRNLAEMVREKTFREDLYYRLNVVVFQLPALREMTADIPVIAQRFIETYNAEYQRQVAGLTPAAEKRLASYQWPGNIRELRNCIERAMIFTESDRIDAPDILLPTSPAAESADGQWEVPPQGIRLDEVERQLIRSALARTGNNITRAAKLLGISRDTLRYRMNKL